METLPSLKQDRGFTPDRFMKFLESRPDEERWQLIDGEPVMMMTPPTLVHQRIGANLERLLNDALEVHRPDLSAVHEVGLFIEGYENFRPVSDLAIIDYDVEDVHYTGKFHLAAEILSATNTREFIGLKRQRYSEAPHCLHVLILAQNEFAIEVWSRSNDWQGRVYRSPEDLIELPEFGFSCVLRDLYRGTPVK